ncbi:hypothetical protein EDD21DRAFT_361963 [Dissophora ornata]|nr:hypothetical protein EDD21DRAFT_361963 [Dissophora ornata]
MPRKLFNDLVTTLDIIPASSTVDLCVHHPTTCALTGKVRVIAKRPCVYKSLVLTVTGTTRVWYRQGPRTIKGKQVFLEVSKEIVFENASSNTSSRRDPPRDSDSSNNSSSSSPITRPPSAPMNHGQPSAEGVSLSPVFGHMPCVQNRLDEGVNDIDFSIEFPSHIDLKDAPPIPAADMYLHSLPSGPLKTTAGDSSIVYTLSATLTMSRKDILVNNQISASMPFRIQGWQDTIDQHSSEDHSYHGKRKGRIEFQFQVAKQLDLRRLQELQFGFRASWKTLQDRLKVKEIQYYLIEEETQSFAARAAPVVNTTIISTSATHDCTGYSVPTRDWGELRAAARLQIPQPNTVLETTNMPAPHSLAIAHKLRVLIRFDQSLGRERDLQLSFPIMIHPTLDEDGSPVHPDVNYCRRSRRQSRRASALYGIEARRNIHGDGESDDEEVPLPMYADREGTLLLMVGQEGSEATGLVAGQIEPLGISMATGYPEQSAVLSPSEASMSSLRTTLISPDNSLQFPPGNVPIQGEQHAWTSMGRLANLSSASLPHFINMSSPESRRHSSFQQAIDLPPPYVLPSLSEETSAPPTPLLVPSGFEVPSQTGSRPESSAAAAPYNTDTAIPSRSVVVDIFEHEGEEVGVRRENGKGKGKSKGTMPPRTITTSTASSSAAGSSRPVPAALPTPPYEIQEEALSYDVDGGDQRFSTSSSFTPPSSSSSTSSSGPSTLSSSPESELNPRQKQGPYGLGLVAVATSSGGAGLALRHHFASAN